MSNTKRIDEGLPVDPYYSIVNYSDIIYAKYFS